MKISSKKYIDNQVHWLEKLTNAEFRAVRQAVDKVETTNIAKFEAQNEWRAQMKDQTGSFLTRRELIGAIVAVATISSAIAGFIAWLIQKAV